MAHRVRGRSGCFDLHLRTEIQLAQLARGPPACSRLTHGRTKLATTDVNEYPLLEGQRLKLLLIVPKRLLCPGGLSIVEKHSGHPLLIEGFQVLNRVIGVIVVSVIGCLGLMCKVSWVEHWLARDLKIRMLIALVLRD